LEAVVAEGVTGHDDGPAAEVAVEVAAEVAADAPAEVSQVHAEVAQAELPDAALLDLHRELLCRAAAHDLDLERIARSRTADRSGDVSGRLDPVPFHARDDVADLDSRLRRRAVSLDRRDQSAFVPLGAEVLAQLRRHLEEADAEVPAPRTGDV